MRHPPPDTSFRHLGFRQLLHFDDKDISTEYSALMSKVMSNGNGRVRFPINEPAEGKRKSQIEEYLDYYLTPGVQHIAMATGNIIDTVRDLKDRGVEFLRVPDTYYERLPSRVGKIKESLASLRELGLLVDRDDEGYLLQIFSRPAHFEENQAQLGLLARQGGQYSFFANRHQDNIPLLPFDINLTAGPALKRSATRPEASTIAASTAAAKTMLPPASR